MIIELLSSKSYLLASFALFLLNFYTTERLGLGLFGYFYLAKPSTTELLIRYNFAIASIVMLLKIMASLVADHLDD